MTFGKTLKTKTDRVSVIALDTSAAALVALFALNVVRIFSRYFFSVPMNWVPGIVALLSNWAVFLGVGVYLYKNEVIVIDYFYEKFIPLKGRKVVDAFVNILVIVFTLLMIRFSWGVILSGVHQAPMLSTLKMNYYWFSFPIVFGMILGLTGALKRLFVPE